MPERTGAATPDNDTPRGACLARHAEATHLIVLGVWLGVLVMVGIAAAVVFPTMRSLAPELPGFAAYPRDHWTIAGGRVMARLFAVADWIGLMMGVLAMLALVVGFGVGGGRFIGGCWRPLGVLRTAACVLAMLIAIGTLAVMRPAMNADLAAFWSAAGEGRVAEADIARARFDAAHPRASMVLSTQAALVLIALTLSLCDAARDRRGHGSPRHDPAGGNP